jgi:hypothetical protein
MNCLFPVLLLCFACSGSPQVIKSCDGNPRPGQYSEAGNLRDVVISEYGEDPSGDVGFYWCSEPIWDAYAGLTLRCNEMYIVDLNEYYESSCGMKSDDSLRIVRHETAHCYRGRILGDMDALHTDKNYWEVVE